MTHTIEQVAHAWWDWMGPMFLQVGVLIVMVSAVDACIRKSVWPQVRYALWLLVLLKLLIPPTWSLPSGMVPGLQNKAIAQLQRMSGAERRYPSENMGGSELAAEAPGSTTQSAAIRRVPPESSGGIRAATPEWQVYALGTWILGMGIFSVLLSTRIRKLRRWHREQEEKKTIPPWFHHLLVRTAGRLNLDHLPAIVFHEKAVTPAVYGVVRPVLLLPAGYFDKLNRSDAEHVLLHELAHLKRGDLWIHGLILLLQIVYWFNPLLIWVRRQTKQVIELCCDLTVANVLREKTRDYRQTLLATARELLTESLEPGMGLLGVFEEPFRLVSRLKWLDKKTWLQRKWMLAAVFAVMFFMVPCILPMAEKPESVSTTPQTGEKMPAIRGPAAGDKAVYIMEVVREKTYFLWKLTDSNVIEVKESWIQGQRMVHMEEEKRRSFIADAEKQTVTVIDHLDKTYVVVHFPPDMSRLLDSRLRVKYMDLRTTGIVKKTKRTREICQTECKEYRVAAWRVQDSQKGRQSDHIVWAAADVPFDLRPYVLFLRTLRRLYNRDEAYQAELLKIDGMQMGDTFIAGRFPNRREVSSLVVEMAEKEPEPGLFSVPAGYTQKTEFEEGNLR